MLKLFSSSTCHWDHEQVNQTATIMFSMLFCVYLTIALVDGKNGLFFFFFRGKKVDIVRILDVIGLFNFSNCLIEV